MSSEQQARDRVKRVLIESLRLEGMTPDAIGDDEPLFGEGLGLDSVDALELVVALEKEYGVRIDSESMRREDFTSVATLTHFVERLTAASPAAESG
ncbi:MAG: phosphopantetheine-binding protein [Thermoanaerobaculia bacterium]